MPTKGAGEMTARTAEDAEAAGAEGQRPAKRIWGPSSPDPPSVARVSPGGCLGLGTRGLNGEVASLPRTQSLLDFIISLLAIRASLDSRYLFTEEEIFYLKTKRHLH